MTCLQDDNGVKCNWNFFATSHGKGAVDGIGGMIKHLVWNNIKSRKITIHDAKEFAAAAQNLVKTTIIFVGKSEIESCIPDLDLRFTDVLPIPDTHKMHCIRTLKKGTVEISNTSKKGGTTFHFKVSGSSIQNSMESRVSNHQTEEDKKISIGCWVVVRFPLENSSRTKDFIGQVTNLINDSTSVVSFTKKSGNNMFVFPENEDIMHVDITSIVGFLNEPQLNSRYQMLFSNCLSMYNL